MNGYTKIYDRLYRCIYFTRRCQFTIFNLTVECTYVERFKTKIPMLLFPDTTDTLVIEKDNLLFGFASPTSNSYSLTVSKDGFKEVWGPTVKFSYNGSDTRLSKSLVKVITKKRYSVCDLTRSQPDINDYKNDNYEVIDGMIYTKIKGIEDPNVTYIIDPKLYSFSFWDFYVNQDKFVIPPKVNVIIYDSKYNKCYDARSFKAHPISL